MEYISRDQFNQMFCNKDELEADDLVYVLEEHFGYNVSCKKKSGLSAAQRRKALQNQDYVTDDEGALKIIHEAQGGK
ncbi:hypothetical protein HUG15_07695 [Salicibibacter cibarius]|uniref:Uncharacterized protein n=1 Tax=Salicibibacter cibarius TaxID=2743000 RepID=A0A7T6Z1Y6_9BACI|nr:hypothetical protein [Salicibibacter cibarius]QQK75475.1 hypothetical protein HUG15_07695 [Salicibibacter cibarius]